MMWEIGSSCIQNLGLRSRVLVRVIGVVGGRVGQLPFLDLRLGFQSHGAVYAMMDCRRGC